MMSKLLVLGLSASLFVLAPLACASQTPELQLVEGFFAAGAADLQTSAGRVQYQQRIQGLITSYTSNHTADPAVASRNLADAFTTLGIPAQEIAQLRTLSTRYAQLMPMQKTPEQMGIFWQHYGNDLASSLATIPYPQGDEFSACQWSVAFMIGGLAVGIPILAVDIGYAMGDQNLNPWIANPGAVAFLVGIGGLIATIPTCLF